MKITEAFSRFLTEYANIRGYAESARNHYRLTARTLVQLLGDLDLTELRGEDVARWVHELGKTKSTNTVRLYLSDLRQVLKFCSLRGIPCLNPGLVPIPKRKDVVPQFLTAEEVGRMVDCACNLRAKFVISFLYSSGVRLSEFLRLNRGDVVDRSFSVVGKGGKARLCFIDARTERLMNSYLATREDNDRALVVSFLNHQRMTATNVQLLVANAARAAGIQKHVTPHTLRHSYATNFLRNNGNLRYLAELMGHSNIQTTAHYAHVVNEDLRAQYEQHHTI